MRTLCLVYKILSGQRSPLHINSVFTPFVGAGVPDSPLTQSSFNTHSTVSPRCSAQSVENAQITGERCSPLHINSIFTPFVWAGVLDSPLIQSFLHSKHCITPDTVLLFCKLLFQYLYHILCLLFKL